MATIDIEIEDYIDEISDYNLMKEITRRINQNGRHNVKDLMATIKELQEEEAESKENGWPQINTLLDEQKRNWVNDNWDNINPLTIIQ